MSNRLRILAVLSLLVAINTNIFAKTWVLDNAEIPNNQVSVELEIYREEKVMGLDVQTTRVVESSVTLGIQHIYTSPIRQSASPPVQARAYRSRYYLVTIPFTLHPLRGDLVYKRLKLEIRVDQKKATAFKLFPDHLTKEEDVEQEYDVSATLGKSGVELSGGGSHTIRFTNLDPVISSFGLGQSNFYWIFEAQKGHPIALGSRKVLVLLEVPNETRVVEGTIRYEAEIGGLLARFGMRPAHTDYCRIYWDLEAAEPISNIPWQPEDISGQMIN